MDNFLRSITGRTAPFDTHLAEKVYLKRVSLFYGHAISNILAALIAGAVLFFVLHNAGVSLAWLIAWYTLLFASCAAVFHIERKFTTVTLTAENAPIWVGKRILAGGAIALSIGATPYLLIGHDAVIAEMFIFIVLSGFSTLAVIGYSVMPQHYLVLVLCAMVPLTISFLLNGDQFHIILAISAIILQYVILRKGLVVSKSSIAAIELNEQLFLAKEQMRHLAYHDSLTGLANRHYFQEWVGKSLARSRRAKTSISFLLIDLNDFKEINDNLGHDVGDAVLEHLASKIKRHIREEDMAVRMGGDEFLIVVEGMSSKPELARFSNKLMTEILQPVTLLGHELTIRASVGMSIFPDDGDDLRIIFKTADEAMYKNKVETKKSA